MTESVDKQVFELIDAMYNDLIHQDVDQQIKDTLFKAAQALTTGKLPAQVVAAKTVKLIARLTMSGQNPLGNQNAKRINQLMCLSRTEGYKWYPNSLGAQGVQF